MILMDFTFIQTYLIISKDQIDKLLHFQKLKFLGISIYMGIGRFFQEIFLNLMMYHTLN